MNRLKEWVETLENIIILEAIQVNVTIGRN